MAFLSKFFGGASTVGVDIGTTTIKIVELAKRGDKPELLNYGSLEGYGYLDRVNNAIQTSSLKLVESETQELLRVLLKQVKIKGKNVVASLPPFSAFSTLIEIPQMSDQETSKVVYYQAKAAVPMPIADATIDWTRIEEFEDERGIKKQRIFLIAVVNENIQRYKKIFSGVGLNLQVLELEGVSLARALTTGDQKLSIIADIGGRSTTITVAGGGLVRYNTQIDFAGSSLTQAVATGLNINMKRAEELKKQRGLIGTGGEYELSTLMSPFLDVILSEVKRVKYFYEKNYKTNIERIILSGGGANLKGIQKYVEREFQLPAEIADPFGRVRYSPSIAPAIAEIGPGFSVAMGLALK
ncbi:MAG: type IV pilus assembly protein PilM [Candidatus Colwellbacteria bacterium]|nr:type IV pilus assembly protein PilM [Candidatus Colwellbacteria bacterium]